MALLTLLSQNVWAEVDDSAPDMSMFKLHRVNVKEAARMRASKPITNLATGALHLRESLFVDEQQIACATYARLFDMIKGALGTDNKIRQNVVESLAVVVVWDKEFYLDLFGKESASESPLGEYFLEAAQKLENRTDQKSRDTWAQLIGCMSAYLAANNKQVAEYLSDSSRAEQVASVNKFNAIPLIENDSRSQLGAKCPSPNGLVRHLAKKLDGEGLTGRTLFGRFISDGLYIRSRKVVEGVESERVLAARRQFEENPQQVISTIKPDPSKSSIELNEPAREPQKLSKFSKKDEPTRVDLMLIDNKSENLHQAMFLSTFSELQLEVLKFVKMRLTGDSIVCMNGPRLSMQLALDFQSHWKDLELIRIDPTTSFGRDVITFLEDEQSKRVARRINLAIRQYVKLISLVAEMIIQEDTLRSVDKLGAYLERLTELLNTMDGAFDVDNVRRIHAIWKAKYVEHRTMERFINSSSLDF